MFNQQIDITQLPVTPHPDPTLAGTRLLQGEGAWRVEFGLWLRNTPSQKRRRRSVLALDAYERDMRLMARWFEEQYHLPFEPSQMNVQNLGEYFAPLEKQPATHKRKLASLRLFIRWAMEAERIEQDPSVWIAYVDVVEEAPRDLNDEEREQLEAAAEAGESSLLGLRDSVIFFLMNDGGLRISEVIGLLESDLHLDEGYIHVLGKGMKHRKVRVASRLIGKIRLWLDASTRSARRRKPTLTPALYPDGHTSLQGEGAALITDERGFAIGRQAAWTRFVLLRDMAGVKATPHSMRHTYVIRYMDAFMKGDPQRWGAALKAVCQQTGDDVKTIIKYYTSPRDSEMRAAAEAM